MTVLVVAIFALAGLVVGSFGRLRAGLSEAYHQLRAKTKLSGAVPAPMLTPLPITATRRLNYCNTRQWRGCQPSLIAIPGSQRSSASRRGTRR